MSALGAAGSFAVDGFEPTAFVPLVGRTRTIAVTSGKGGVGKTCLTANLAVALARQGSRVLVIDADLGLANVDTMLGLHADTTLRQVLQGECGLEEVLLDGPHGIKVVPAASGFEDMSRPGGAPFVDLLGEIDRLSQSFDAVLIDTSAGISPAVLCFTLAASERLVVATPEPTSLTDAYAVMKILSTRYGERTFGVLMNMVRNRADALRAFEHLARVTTRFLGFTPDYRGCLPWDPTVPEAIRRQQPLLSVAPRAPISLAIDDVAARLRAEPSTQRPMASSAEQVR